MHQVVSPSIWLPICHRRWYHCWANLSTNTYKADQYLLCMRLYVRLSRCWQAKAPAAGVISLDRQGRKDLTVVYQHDPPSASARRLLEHFSRWLIGQPVTTVRKPAQSVPLADGIERLRYGFHQGLLRASLDAA